MSGTPAGNSSGARTSTDLAIERTRLAFERTLMAWVRTGVSLISFGFAVYKFFEFEIEKGDLRRSSHLLGPREFAIILIGIGVFALLAALVQHVQSMRRLRGEPVKMPLSIAAVVAGMMALFGLFALFGAIFQA